MEIKYESSIVKIPAKTLRQMSLKDVLEFMLNQPSGESPITFSSLHPIYVLNLNDDVSVKLTIIMEAY